MVCAVVDIKIHHNPCEAGVYSRCPEIQIQKLFLKQQGKFQRKKNGPSSMSGWRTPRKKLPSIPAGNLINPDNPCKQAADQAEFFTGGK